MQDFTGVPAVVDLSGIESFIPGGRVNLTIGDRTTPVRIDLVVRMNTALELEYYKACGILRYVLKRRDYGTKL
jgi:aconitase A